MWQLLSGPVERFSLATKHKFTLAETAPNGMTCALKHKSSTNHGEDVDIVLPTSPWIAQTAAQHFGTSIEDKTKATC